MKRKEPKASVKIDYYDDYVIVSIDNFERINARQIQEGIGHALREWQTLQQTEIRRVRKGSSDAA